MKIKLKILFFLASYGFIGTAFAQLEVSERLQYLNSDELEAQYEMVNRLEKGLLLLKIPKPYNKDDPKEIEVEYLDKNLKKTRKEVVKIPYRFIREHVPYYNPDEDQFLYWYHQEESYSDIQLWRYDIEKGIAESYKIKSPVKMDVEDFITLGDRLFVLGEFNGKPVVYYYSFVENRSQVISVYQDKNDEIVFTQSDAQGQQLFFTLYNPGRQNCRLILKPFSNLIGSLDVIRIPGRREKTPRSSMVFSSDGSGDRTLLGTYSEECSRNIQGFFVSNFDDKEELDTKYYPFIELTNFFNYQPEKRAERMREKVHDKLDQGKDYNLTRKFILHDQLYPLHKDQVWVVEGYYSVSQARTANNLNNSYLGYNNFRGFNYYRPYYRNWGFNSLNTRPPLSHEYRYAVVLGFDQDGRLQWDNVMKIENVENDELIPITQLATYGDSLVMAYRKEEALYSKLMYRYNTIRKEKEQDIEEILEPYEVNNIIWGELEQWYDNHYLYLGEQRVKNDSGSKRVFAITKLSYVPQEEEEPEAVKTKKKQAPDDQK